MLSQCRVWAAESYQTGEVVGFAALRDELFEHLFLRPDVQRQCVGTQMLDEARAASPAGLTLRVFIRNTAARAFYERHGFDQLDENDGSRNEENEPDMTYTWSGRG